MFLGRLRCGQKFLFGWGVWLRVSTSWSAWSSCCGFHFKMSRSSVRSMVGR